MCADQLQPQISISTIVEDVLARHTGLQTRLEAPWCGRGHVLCVCARARAHLSLLHAYITMHNDTSKRDKSKQHHQWPFGSGFAGTVIPLYDSGNGIGQAPRSRRRARPQRRSGSRRPARPAAGRLRRRCRPRPAACRARSTRRPRPAWIRPSSRRRCGRPAPRCSSGCWRL